LMKWRKASTRNWNVCLINSLKAAWKYCKENSMRKLEMRALKKLIEFVKSGILVPHLIERFDVSGNSFSVSTSVLDTSCRSSAVQSHEEFWNSKKYAMIQKNFNWWLKDQRVVA
jgi:hypothetical protein